MNRQSRSGGAGFERNNVKAQDMSIEKPIDINNALSTLGLELPKFYDFLMRFEDTSLLECL